MVILKYIIILLILLVCYGISWNVRKYQKIEKVNKEIEEKNCKIKNDNQVLCDKYEQNQKQLQNLNLSIQNQNQILLSLKETEQALINDAKQKADLAYAEQAEKNQKQLESEYQLIFDEQMEKIAVLSKQINMSTQALQDLENKQLAYIKAQQRQEEINQSIDYYKLTISNNDKDDIELLRDVQKRLIKKESIDKIIYDVYYKPAYDILMSHLFKEHAKDKTSGIYKITDISSGLAYIGQSTQCQERIKTHIKNTISKDKGANKLYQHMQKVGLQNFTFEILELVPKEKLDERELYWINFYKTNTFGLNSTKGNGGS